MVVEQSNKKMSRAEAEKLISQLTLEEKLQLDAMLSSLEQKHPPCFAPLELVKQDAQ